MTDIHARYGEVVARALCIEGGFDPDERMPNDGPRWRYYEPGAKAAIDALLPALGEWQAMESAPRDRSYVLVKVRDGAFACTPFSHYAGRYFVAYHEGLTPSGFDMGWGLFPGFGGVSDRNLAGWMPLPFLPTPPETGL